MEELKEELALRKQFGNLIKQRYLKILNNIMSRSECIPTILNEISKETQFNEMKKAHILAKKDLFDQATELIDTILLSSAAVIRVFIQQLEFPFPGVYQEIICQERPLDIIDELQCLNCHILQRRIESLEKEIEILKICLKKQHNDPDQGVYVDMNDLSL